VNLSALLFSFAGRVNRAPWWIVAIVIYFVFMTLFWVAIGLAFAGLGGPAIAIGVGMLLATLWVAAALGVKRLHDRGKSGWWLLLFYLAPTALHAAGRHAHLGGRGLMLIGFAISIWAFVELGFRRGTVGQNRYGPDPLQRA
jgi:uncharacterized membrane protein YhaH (DUF805 family)